MSIPDFNSDVSPYNLGVTPNHSDDDAEVLDNLVEQDATPPEPVDIPRFDIPPVPKVDIPPILTMRTRTIWLPPLTPFLLVAADPWRKSIQIESEKTFAFRVAANESDVRSDITSYTATYPQNGDFTVNYNGALWIYQTTGETFRMSILTISEEPQR